VLYDVLGIFEYLNDAPIEVSAAVLSFLGHKRLCRLACVSHSWCSMTSSSVVWRACFESRWTIQVLPKHLQQSVTIAQEVCVFLLYRDNIRQYCLRQLRYGEHISSVSAADV
jgi:F-box domain